ncbi:biotin apo-protein ligase [Histoplasma capsulatum H143]|uniref:Biotin apo-protein ligase n=1 Tax=Ajellomyces capsulatus (strain H143) TaxID=544712 RepID=C6HI48_AJECH|nr:biotin apo-protein ligase [Histoplasma capsulatum H143]
MTTNPVLLSKRLNVLVYSGAQTYSDWKTNILTPAAPGNGTTVDAVRHCLYSLRRLLAANYAVIPVTGQMIVNEPWTASCALLDSERRKGIGGLVNLFSGAGRTWVFARAVTLPANGCAFPGFVYDSEDGARAAELKVSKSAQAFVSVPEVFKAYYNGGGVFVDAPKYADQGVEVLASYTEDLSVDSGEGSATVVYCKVGEGAAILTGAHPEFVFPAKPIDSWELTKPRFAASNLDRNADGPEYHKIVDVLAADDESRVSFLKACLTKLGLQVNQDSSTVPSLSRLHLSSLVPQGSAELISALRDIITVTDGEEYIKDDIDTFHLEKPSSMGMRDIAESLPAGISKTGQGGDSDTFLDYNSVIKEVVVHDEIPSSKATPSFNHHAFYGNLKEYRSQSKEEIHEFGSNILYGEVVTSTSSLLEKYEFHHTAYCHVLSLTRIIGIRNYSEGSHMDSWLLRRSKWPDEAAGPTSGSRHLYIAAIAIAQGIKSYDKGYENMPIKLMWTYDIENRLTRRHWLHMDQIVTLEAEGGVRARIKGITSDYGLLVAEELGWEDRPTGKTWELQSDSNSFDFFKGLIKRKV